MSDLPARRVLVTGASAGIGRHAALTLASQGWTVFAGARRVDRLATLREEAGERLIPLELDVDAPGSITRAAATVAEHTGGYGVDGLVNNAGIAIAGAMAEVDDADLRAQFETNVFGLVAVTRAFLPGMLARRGGRIVNVSSSGGRISLPLVGVYHASKYAVESLSDAYRMELRPFGIRVSLIEPGPVRTEFGDKLKSSIDRVSDGSPWAPVRAQVDAIDARAERAMLGPEVITRDIVHALTARRPRARYVEPRWMGLLLTLNQLAPTWLSDRVISRMMGMHLVGR